MARYRETVLWGVEKGGQDWEETVITTSTNPDDPKFTVAEEWARKNGFDRFRKATIDLWEE